jgi:uncharacterized protein (DUF58 family)
MKQVLKPSRLLLGCLCVLAGLALLLGSLSALQISAAQSLQPFYCSLLLALLALALVDAWRLLRMTSPEVQRQLPASQALGRWSDVRLQVSHDYPRVIRVQLFDHLPEGFETEYLPQAMALRPGETSQLSYRVRALRRGLFELQQCEIELPSVIGLWHTRRYLQVQDQTRVYPDFTRLHGGQLLAANSWPGRIGVHQRQRRGPGTEFHQLREFREGDSLRQIDWKATARHRAPIAREYQEESDQHIVFMLDCGRRMRSQDGDLSHFDHALNAMLLLSHVALRQGDAVGLSTFAGEHSRYIAPAKGTSHLNTLLNRTYDLDSGRRPADYSAAAKQILVRQKRQALVIMMTNMRDEDDEELLAAVTQLGRRHRVLVVSLREQVLDSMRHAPVRTLEDALDYCGAIELLGARNTLLERMKAQRIAVIDARPEELGAQMISRYLNWKKTGTL